MRRAALLVLGLVMSCPSVAAMQAPAKPPAAPNPNAFSSIIDRPLFDPTRRRYVPPPEPKPRPVVEAPVVTAPDPSAPELLGVVTDQERAIVVVRGGDGSILRLAPGEAIDGWRIVAVRPRGVDVERQGVRQSLELPEQGSGASPPIAPPL